MADVPNDYRDPYWSDLASTTEQKLGLPDGLLASIVQNGEKSNNDQVSSAGAKTPFQITPSTRKAALDKFGVDAYLSPQNAAEVSGLLLKDSLARNQGDATAAVAEYHGGTDRANWGPKTQAYVQRVLGNDVAGAPASTFDKLRAQQAANTAPSIANVYAAYRDGKMSQDDAAAFEQEVQAGTIMLPRGASLKPGAGAPPNANPDIGQPGAPAQPAGSAGAGTPVPPSMLAAYKAGQMSQQDRQDFEALVRSGDLSLPSGVDLGTPDIQHPDLIDRAKGLPGAIEEAVTGAQRHTAATDAAPDWGSMPELNSFSMKSFKAGLGTMMTGPEETAQIIKSQFPGVQVSRDEKGNYLLQSSIDGKTYAIKPGFQAGDIPRAIGAVAAFTPAGRAATLPGMMVGSAATQAAIEGTQAGTGGSFDPGQVAVAGALPAAVAGVGAVARAAATPARAVLGRVIPGAAAETPAAAATEGALADAAPQVGAMQAAAPEAAPAAQAADAGAVPGPAAAAPIAAPAEPVTPMTADDLAAAARQAANGNSDARAVLAQQAAPDQKVLDAAKRLGIEDYLQPDHVTTNQAYRELAQAVKSVPGSTARASELEGLTNVAQRADKLVDEIGGTTDYSTLSADVKKSLQDTHDELFQKANGLYDQVRAAIPAKADAPAPNVLAMIQQRADELQGAKNLSPAERMILSKLSPKTTMATENVPGNPLMPGSQAGGTRVVQTVKQPTYALLDDVRRDLTAALYKNRGPFKDTDQALITRLQGALRQDQEAVAQQYGMGDTWNLAQNTAQTYKGLQNDLTSLFGKNLDGSLVGGLQLGVKRLAAGDVSSFVRLLKSIPEDMRPQVVASGLNTAFSKAANRGAISFSAYANWYEGLLRNKQAYTALMANLPKAARKQLSDLYRVSRSISLASRERIATGRLQVVAEQIKGADSLVQKLYDAARHSAAGAAAATVVGHIPVIGHGAAAAVASALTPAKPAAIKAVDELIASPEFTALAKSAGTGAQSQAVSRFAYSKEFSKFMRSLGAQRDISNRERWVVDALEASHESHSNTQQ